MCTSLKKLEEQGRKDGLAEGLQIGHKDGLAEGLAEGLEKGLLHMVTTLKELNIPSDIILQKLQEKFDLNEESAKRYL